MINKPGRDFPTPLQDCFRDQIVSSFRALISIIELLCFMACSTIYTGEIFNCQKLQYKCIIVTCRELGYPEKCHSPKMYYCLALGCVFFQRGG